MVCISQLVTRLHAQNSNYYPRLCKQTAHDFNKQIHPHTVIPYTSVIFEDSVINKSSADIDGTVDIEGSIAFDSSVAVDSSFYFPSGGMCFYLLVLLYSRGK
jgi:hypothetical protein